MPFDYVHSISLQIVETRTHIFQIKPLLDLKGCYYAVVLFDYVAGYCFAEQVRPESLASIADYVEYFPVAQMPVWNNKVTSEHAPTRWQPKLGNRI